MYWVPLRKLRSKTRVLKQALPENVLSAADKVALKGEVGEEKGLRVHP